MHFPVQRNYKLSPSPMTAIKVFSVCNHSTRPLNRQHFYKNYAGFFRERRKNYSSAGLPAAFGTIKIKKQ